ncbi:MAG: nucleotidyltransferase domain-containing protein [Rhizobiaceae bacterium]
MNQPLQAFLDRASVQFEISSAKLFGSHARADHNANSDVDVAIFLKGAPGDFARTKMALADIAYDILLDHGILIEPLPVWEDELIHPDVYSNPRLLENIQREGIRI